MNTLCIETKYHTYSLYRSIYAPVESNMYMMIIGQEALVVDSIISEEMLEVLKNNHVQKVHLFLTHEHYDHSHGVCWLKRNIDMLLYAHIGAKGEIGTKKRSRPRLVAFVLSVKDMQDGGSRCKDFEKNLVDYELEADTYLEEGDSIKIGEHEISVIHLPGHTPGSCLYLLDNEIAFTGDSMIEGNKIITSFRGGDKKNMLHVTLPKLKALPNDLVIMPGHGNPFKKEQFNFDIYDV